MKVLLIQSYANEKHHKPVYPIGLVNMGTVLKKENNTVSLCDLNLIGEDYMNKIQDIIDNFKPDTVIILIDRIYILRNGKSISFYDYIPPLIRHIRSCLPQCTMIACGSAFSIYAEEIFTENADLDYGVIGDCEKTILRLLVNLGDISNIENLCYRNDNDIIFTERNYSNEIFEYISPDYELLSPALYYTAGSFSIGIETKRGCPMRCSYCNYPYLAGFNFRFRKTDLIINDIKRLYFNYKIQSFRFIDPVFNKPLKQSNEILNKLNDLEFIRKLKWSASFSEHGFSKDFAKKCYDAGCRSYNFFPGGYSKETLIALKKGLKTNEINRVPEILNDLKDISIGFSFYLFPPRQTLIGFFSLLYFSFKTRLLLKSRIKSIKLNNIRIEPHTDIQKRAIKEGIITPDKNMLGFPFYRNKRMKFFEILYNVIAGSKNFIRDAFRRN